MGATPWQPDSSFHWGIPLTLLKRAESNPESRLKQDTGSAGSLMNTSVQGFHSMSKEGRIQSKIQAQTGYRFTWISDGYKCSGLSFHVPFKRQMSAIPKIRLPPNRKCLFRKKSTKKGNFTLSHMNFTIQPGSEMTDLPSRYHRLKEIIQILHTLSSSKLQLLKSLNC